jgi:S-adenosylmethionine:tRNA ribosyltransferase-isomerase
MDSEQVKIEEKATEIVNNAKLEKRKICAVGTTVMRTIESAVNSDDTLNDFEGWTNKYIFPPYDFRIANCMVTNFHMPKSTLLMMISAFMGHELMEKAYKEAIKEKYKFYSYGDAMLIL